MNGPSDYNVYCILCRGRQAGAEGRQIRIYTSNAQQGAADGNNTGNGH